ncbi:17588_t:CDS:10 [Entrophospora sp. SA101]|nr:17588_t:CDS:10 [Entrophospora sp. SA101]
MPTVNVDKEEFYKCLGKQYSTEEFRELCFEFGIELEEDTSEKEMAQKEVGAEKAEGLSERSILKIDIPANRYDLLCHEGISKGILIFQGKSKMTTYKLIEPENGKSQIIIKQETAQIRPHVVAPFTYEALKPNEIKFTPLNQTKEMTGEELMQFYENDKHLGKFLHIIKDSPVYPVIYDSNRIVCSLPPIINGEHSKLTLATKNVFIECTATDLSKAKIVLNTVVTMFSEYCEQPFTVEPVEVIYPDGTCHTYPNLNPRRMEAKVDYINACIGIKLNAIDIIKLLNRMSLSATISDKDENLLLVDIPPTRADILHACDIMEDVAIAYGFNNIPKTFPNSATVGKAFPINKLSDLVRREIALSGFTEVLPLILCSHDENFAYLNKKDDNKTAVKLANPKTAEYQVVRTSLLPGILKTVKENKKHSLPIKVFEVSDVAFKDDSQERRARNERHVCALHCAKGSGFETIHGLVNRLMNMLHVELVPESSDKLGYYIKESNDPTYFPNRSADIFLRQKTNSETLTTKKIGNFGIIHPKVLENFEIIYPCSALEFNLDRVVDGAIGYKYNNWDPIEPQFTIHKDVCTLPPEYCEFGPTTDKCKEWLNENHQDLFEKLYSQGNLEQKLAGTSLEGKKTISEADEKKKAKAAKLERELKKKMASKIIITRIARNKRKSVTNVYGLHHFGNL